MKTDHVLLTHKVTNLNKENNELKHRLNKLVKADKTLFSSKSKNRLGSHMARGIKKIKNKRALGQRKHSHQIISPKIKKVLSNRMISDQQWNIAFGRRETFDVNNSGRLLNLGHQDESNHRNSEMMNIMTSDEESSANYLRKTKNPSGIHSSKNQFMRSGGSNRSYIECNNTISQLKANTCHWNDFNKNFKIMGNHQNIPNSKRINQDMGNSHIWNCDTGRQSMENELMNHVSNAVSSFLSMHDEKGTHCRKKSKSDLGFTNPGNYGNFEECNEYENQNNEASISYQRQQRMENNILKEYNGWRNLKERCYSNSQQREQKKVSKYFPS